MKKYRTESGLPVRLICTDGINGLNRFSIGLVKIDDVELIHVYDEELKSMVSKEFDLVEITPWQHIKVDQPVYVKDKRDIEWFKRHFAKVINGKPHVWAHGATKWSSEREPSITSWHECITIEEYEALQENEK